MTFVDSSVWIDYFRGRETAHTHALDSLLGRELVVTGDLVLVEVLQGFGSDREFDLARRRLEPVAVIMVGDRAIALQAARNYRNLRARGVTVGGTVDCLIATRCIEDGLDLLYSDRDFDPFVRHLGLRSAITAS